MAKNSQMLIEIGPGISLMLGLPTLAIWNNIGRPKKPQSGVIGFNTSTQSLEYYDGKNWFSSTMNKA